MSRRSWLLGHSQVLLSLLPIVFGLALSCQGRLPLAHAASRYLREFDLILGASGGLSAELLDPDTHDVVIELHEPIAGNWRVLETQTHAFVPGLGRYRVKLARRFDPKHDILRVLVVRKDGEERTRVLEGHHNANETESTDTPVRVTLAPAQLTRKVTLGSLSDGSSVGRRPQHIPDAVFCKSTDLKRTFTIELLVEGYRGQQLCLKGLYTSTPGAYQMEIRRAWLARAQLDGRKDHMRGDWGRGTWYYFDEACMPVKGDYDRLSAVLELPHRMLCYARDEGPYFWHLESAGRYKLRLQLGSDGDVVWQSPEWEVGSGAPAARTLRESIEAALREGVRFDGGTATMEEARDMLDRLGVSLPGHAYPEGDGWIVGGLNPLWVGFDVPESSWEWNVEVAVFPRSYGEANCYGVRYGWRDSKRAYFQSNETYFKICK